MGCAKVIFFTVVLSLAWARGAEETWIRAAPPCDFPAMYNFGDSNSDTGGASATFGPIPPPYGESFFRRPAGRASDGRLIIDFIGKKSNPTILLVLSNSPYPPCHNCE